MPGNDRLGRAEWVLERQLAWISAADVKVGVLIALHTALLGGLAAAFTTSSLEARTWYAYLATLGAVVFSVLAVVSAAKAVQPQTDGPPHSLVFFGCIADMPIAAYRSEFEAATDADLLEDWTTQIHRNAEIASKKYKHLSRSINYSFGAALLFLPAIGFLVRL